MAQNTVQYINKETHGPSHQIWKDCPFAAMLQDPGLAYGFYEDFQGFKTGVTTESHNRWYCFKDTNATVKPTPTIGNGVALFGTTDNDEVCISRTGTLLSAPFMIPASSADGYKLWFEASIKRSVITDAKGGFFVGLADETACANEFMVDAGNDFSDVDLLGFWGDETDDSTGSHVHVITQKTSAAFDTIIDTVAEMVADTYMKLGFVYDPFASAAKRIKFFVDGVEQSTYVGETSSDATVYLEDTTNFPGGEEMAAIIGLKNAHADDFTVNCRWARCYQLAAGATQSV